MKKISALMGLAAGLLAILIGILILSGSIGGNTSYYAYSESISSYDSGRTTFGADFYTYVNNNAANAVTAIKNTNNAIEGVGESLEDLFHLVRAIGGWGILLFGLFVTFLFAGKLQEKAPAAGTAPVAWAAAPAPTATQAAPAVPVVDESLPEL
jgi:hypothetical protein